MRQILTMFFFAALLHGCDVADRGDLPDLSSPAGEGDACVGNADCASPTLLCAYPIADGCAAKGHCARVATPTCASVIELCGCDGKKVLSGPCYFQAGFASGPTTGAKLCGDGGT
jgi:hypothetical protein